MNGHITALTADTKKFMNDFEKAAELVELWCEKAKKMVNIEVN